jgi:hypothetical protein
MTHMTMNECFHRIDGWLMNRKKCNKGTRRGGGKKTHTERSLFMYVKNKKKKCFVRRNSMSDLINKKKCFVVEVPSMK